MSSLLCVTIILLCTTAIALSAALLWHVAAGRSLPGCGTGAPCDDVLATRWSRWLGMPVAGLAMMTYLVILASSIVLILPAAHASHALARIAAVTLSMGATVAALWFLGLQAFVIHRWCAYCVGVHVVSLTLGLLVMLTLGRTLDTSARPITVLITIGGMALLIGGQAFVRPKRYEVKQAEEEAKSSPNATVPTAGPADTVVLPIPNPPTAQLAAGREIRLLAGRVRLRAEAWPLLGPPDAKSFIACFFDYTCASCRHVHHMIVDAVEHFRPHLAVLMIPVPQDPACNAWIRDGGAVRSQACSYARLGLRAWQAGPAVYAEYEQWFCTCGVLPTLEYAMGRVRELTAFAGDDPSAPDATSDDLIARAIEIHRTSRAGAGKVPVILLPKAVISGEIPNSAELQRILAKELALDT